MDKTQIVTSPKNRVLGLRVIAGLAAVAALATAAPVITTAVSAGVSLLALAGIGAVLVGAFQTMPLLGQKLENRLLAARKAEARANPIEQLQNFLRAKRRSVDAFKAAVVQIDTQIKSMSDMIEDRRRAKPGYDAGKQEKALDAMRAAHSQLVTKYRNAEAALADLQEVIDDKKFEWKFGEAGKAAIQSMNATSGQDLLDEMLADEAFDSVRQNFNAVFSELEMEAGRLNTAKELSFDDGMTIDLTAISIPMAEKVRR